jgi:protein-ribulosamine 3-kinase
MLTQVPAEIQQEILQQLNCTITNFQFISGGCINNGGKLKTSLGDYFLKWNSSQKYPGMFLTESRGLNLLRSSSSIKIPDVILAGASANFQFLLLEFIVPRKPVNNYWAKLGEELGAIHKHTSDFFGLEFDNYIGSLPQSNSKSNSWISFFIEQRLTPQLNRAYEDKKIGNEIVAKFEKLFSKLQHLLPEAKPSLLHGDLWSGNVIVDHHGGPCLIDPAIFYGNREVEIAFTHLFGGFEQDFYNSYQSTFPLENGFRARIDLYNLYPLLVHVNLFGQGYVQQVVSILKNYV